MPTRQVLCSVKGHRTTNVLREGRTVLSMWSKRLEGSENGTMSTRQVLCSVKGHRTTKHLTERKKDGKGEQYSEREREGPPTISCAA